MNTETLDATEQEEVLHMVMDCTEYLIPRGFNPTEPSLEYIHTLCAELLRSGSDNQSSILAVATKLGY